MTRSAPRSAAPEGPPRGAPDRQRPGARPRPSAGHYRRRRLAALLVVVLVGLGVGARALVYDAGLADVEDVRVTGVLTVATPDVLAAAAVPVGTPLADVDTATIADRVARLPAVASVRVTRGWPHTVTVAVTERVPVAATPAG
ncbi:MAG: FtsQ-type POTRA domain-containing protein, partial [Pseudonocardia sp.]|nr:FtsQ-type POTRA domain-containing protein [Pseudonocardia sp.]